MKRKISKPSDYPALECPDCGKLTKCNGIAKDGGAMYRCRVWHGGNGQSFSWWIDRDGNLRFGKSYA